MTGWRPMVAMLAAATLALSACGGDDAASTTTMAGTSSVGETTTAAPAATTSIAPPHPLDLSSQEICEMVPSADVAEALDVDIDDVVPFEEASPQCSYQFLLDDGQITNAIVNVPTIREFGERSGDDAFDYVLGFYDGENYTQTVTDMGDRSLVLSSPAEAEAGVHVGVIRLGERVVITIVSVGMVEMEALLRLNELVAEQLRP